MNQIWQGETLSSRSAFTRRDERLDSVSPYQHLATERAIHLALLRFPKDAAVP